MKYLPPILGIFLLLLGNADARPLKVGYFSWIGWSPLNVAHEKGFWKDQGLEIIPVTFSTEKEARDAMREKKIDIVFQMLGDIPGLVHEGISLKIIGELDWSNGGDKIVINRKLLTTKKYQDARIGVYSEGTAIQFFLDRFLTKHGAELKKTNLVFLDSRPLTNALLKNQLDMIVNYDPQALRAEREGRGVVVATSASFPGILPEGVCLIKGGAEVSREDQKKFFRGWLKALRWIQNPRNFSEYRNILNRTIYSEQTYGEEDIVQMLGNVSLHDASRLVERNQMGGGLYWYLDDLRRFLKRSGMKNSDFKPEDVMATDALMAVLSEEDAHSPNL